jgi:large subunit ribosomal protein L9
MKVLLTQDVDNLGLAGEVHDVAAGYGRNFLIPRGLAELATPGALTKADLHRRRAAEKRQRIAEEMASLAEMVREKTLVFRAKAGQKGRLYGSVTNADIAEKLTQEVGEEIDRRKLVMEGSIKEVGTHQVSLRLSADISADFDVVVESIEPLEESEEETAEEEALVEEEPSAEEPVAEE